MSNKVVLILVDGMRPDGAMSCGNAFAQKLLTLSAHSLAAATVMPSVTLPCHMTLFHSVNPDRHGILTNTYVPQVRPIDGLFDQLDKYEKNCGFFYTWEQLRDLCRPGHLDTALYLNLHKNEDSDNKITDAALAFIKEKQPDFTFLYLGETDEVGHAHGWMSDEYLKAVNKAFSCIERVHAALPENYDLIVLADHGGHARSHGTEMSEDMTIPMYYAGPDFDADTEIAEASIKDVAPTVVKILGVPPVKEWEGMPRCK